MARVAFEAHPVTKERWPDLVELFDRPIVRTCFCMFYRKTGAGTGHGSENRQAMKAVDDRPVCSIVCFFVGREARGRGLAERMLRAATDHARSCGARLVEAYPVDRDERSHPDVMFFGAMSMYDRAGFREVARRRPSRPVVRKALRPRSPTTTTARVEPRGSTSGT